MGWFDSGWASMYSWHSTIRYQYLEVFPLWLFSYSLSVFCIGNMFLASGSLRAEWRKELCSEIEYAFTQFPRFQPCTDIFNFGACQVQLCHRVGLLKWRQMLSYDCSERRRTRCAVGFHVSDFQSVFQFSALPILSVVTGIHRFSGDLQDCFSFFEAYFPGSIENKLFSVLLS